MLHLKLKGKIKHELRKSDNFDFKPLEFDSFKDLLVTVIGKEYNGTSSIYIKEPIYPVISRDDEFEYFINSEYLDEFLDTFSVTISSRAGRGIGLTPFEFYRLLDSYRSKHINNSVLFHYITADGIISHCVVDQSTPIKSFLETEFKCKDAYFPLLKKGLKEHITAAKITSHLISDNRWSINRDNGFLFPFPKYNRPITLEYKQYQKEKDTPCINCRKCMDYCPESIFPAFYYHYIEREMEEEVSALGIKDCTLCGLCNFVCPSNLKITERIEQFLMSEEVEP